MQTLALFNVADLQLVYMLIYFKNKMLNLIQNRIRYRTSTYYIYVCVFSLLDFDIIYCSNIKIINTGQ